MLCTQGVQERLLSDAILEDGEHPNKSEHSPLMYSPKMLHSENGIRSLYCPSSSVSDSTPPPCNGGVFLGFGSGDNAMLPLIGHASTSDTKLARYVTAPARVRRFSRQQTVSLLESNEIHISQSTKQEYRVI
jgi:hypothetical protein